MNAKAIAIRGAMTTIVKKIHFRNGQIDDFNSEFDNLPPYIKENWALLARLITIIIEPKQWESGNTCKCVIHNNERYHHPHCTSFHTTKAVGHVGGEHLLTNPQLFRGIWTHSEPIDSIEDIICPCPFNDKICPVCGKKLEPNPSGWSCAEGHGF